MDNIWIDGKGKEHAAFAREAAWHKLGRNGARAPSASSAGTDEPKAETIGRREK